MVSSGSDNEQTDKDDQNEKFTESIQRAFGHSIIKKMAINKEEKRSVAKGFKKVVKSNINSILEKKVLKMMGRV